MTGREQDVAKLAQLRTEVEVLVQSYNAALLNSDLNAAVQANNTMTEKVNEYTSIARTICFCDCKSSSDPMLAAVKMLTFKTIATKDEKVGDDKVNVRKVVEKEMPIDLAKLDKFCGGIGADKDWMWIAEKMNYLMTAQKAVDLGLDPRAIQDNYLMSDISKQISMGKTPTSKSNILRTLQTVITAMVGEEYKATSHDVNYLLSIYAKKNRQALSVTCANHTYFRRYIAEICHRIVTGKSYEVCYKAKKA